MTDLDDRIRKRAYQLWEEEGFPPGRADVHWDKASELVAIEDNQKLAMHPVRPDGLDEGDIGPEGEPVEPAREALQNEGEFPTLTDQGEAEIPHHPDSKRPGGG